MRFFRDASIRFKVLIPSAVLVLALGLVSSLALYGLNEQRAALSAVNEIALEKIPLIHEFVILSERVQSDVFRIAVLQLMNLPGEETEPIHERLEQGLNDLDIIYGQILAKWPLDETERSILERMKGPMDAFRQQALQATAVVSDDPSFGVLLVRSSAVPFAEFRTTFTELHDYQHGEISRVKMEAIQKANTVSAAIIAGAFLIALAGVLATVLISTRWISGPILSITDLMGRLAESDLSIEVRGLERRDEIGAMARAVEVFRDNAIEKARLDEELRESEEKSRSIVNSSPMGMHMYQLEPDGRLVFTGANPAADVLLGVDNTQFIGKTIEEAFPPLAETEVPEKYRLAASEGEPWQTEQIAYEDEQIKGAFEVRAFQTSPGRMVAMFLDITERKRAEEELRIKDSAIASSINAVAIADLAGNLTYVNNSWLKMYGYDDDKKVMGKPSLEFFAVKESAAAAMEALRDAGNWAGELAVETKDGSLLDIHLSASIVTDVAGKPTYIMASGIDITERKQAEEEIRQRTAQLEALREVSLELTTQLDLDALLHSVVSQAVELLGGAAGGLNLYRPDRDVLEWTASIGLDPVPSKAVLRRGEGLAGKVMETGEPLIVDDYQAWEKRAAIWEGYPLGALVGVPVRWGEEFLGVLEVMADPPRTFSPADAELLSLFASQAAIAIENASLFQAEQKQRQDAEAVRQAALALTSALERNQVIERILAQLQKVVPYDSASVQLLQGDRLALIGGQGIPNLEELLGVSFPVDDDNPNREVMRTLSHFVLEDAPAVYEAFTREPFAQMGIRSWLGVPMLIGQRLVGMLTLDKCQPGFYTQEHARLAQAFAAQAAIAIENARLFEEIEERRMYLEGVLGAAPDAIVTLDAHHRIVEWNPGAEKLFGYSREEVSGQDIDYLVTSPDVFEEAAEFMQVVIGRMEVPPTETVRYRKDGSPVDVIVAGSPILVGDEVIGAVAAYTDITARKRMEDTLRALLLLDELTGLYNRRGFVTLSQHQLKTANRMKRRMALLFADFDGLKLINDTFGHPEGDRALIEVADALRETFRESDIIARIAGDEFVVLAIETGRVSSEVLATRLQENLEARNARGDRRYKLSLSVGIARYDSEHSCSIDELLAQADRAMYEKKQGAPSPPGE